MRWNLYKGILYITGNKVVGISWQYITGYIWYKKEILYKREYCIRGNILVMVNII
jgi:hypothetical protein